MAGQIGQKWARGGEKREHAGNKVWPKTIIWTKHHHHHHP